MSKAFTKESDGDDSEDEGADASVPALPAGAKNYMTPSGAAKLKAELRKLLYTERPELVRIVGWAAGNGDRSENGDYIYGKRRLREIDRRIRFLTKRLEAAEVVDPGRQTADRVLFGARVMVEDEAGRRRQYQIVGVDETDVRHGQIPRISWISPLARALLNAKQGDVVTLRTPKGPPEGEELEIIAIEYVPDEAEEG